MSEKKELPVSGGLFFPYHGHGGAAVGGTAGGGQGVANANGSQTSSSSNFNPFAFNPLAGVGYPQTAQQAFYSQPFSMLPFAAAAAAAAAASSQSGNANSVVSSMAAPFLNAHQQSQMLSAFPPAANPMWSGLMPPDYLLNIAALQSLQQQHQQQHQHHQHQLQNQPIVSAAIMDGSGETFNDVLKKMPRASANAGGDGSYHHRNSSVGHSSVSRERIPSTAASNSSSTTPKMAASSASASIGKQAINNNNSETNVPRASSSTASSFSATSLAISDQKLASPSSCSSTFSGGGGDSSTTHHHSSSLATLAEIASTLQNSDRYETKATTTTTKNSGERKVAVKKETKLSDSDHASDQLRQLKNKSISSAAAAKDDGSTKISATNNNSGGHSTSILDFSNRKRSSTKMMNSQVLENGEIIRKKEPKLELVDHHSTSNSNLNSNSKTENHQHQSKNISRKDDKDKDNKSRNRHETSSVSENAAAAAAAAATLFGTSLSSDLKMDPNLLNASAMAWAALSNQWLFANVQNEIMNRAAAATLQQQQQQQQSSTVAGGNNRSQNSSKSPAVVAENSSIVDRSIKKARVHQRNSGDNDLGNSRRSSRGRPATISTAGQQQQSIPSTENKDAVDATIDAVIKQQQQEIAAAAAKSASDDEPQRKSSSGPKSKRGRGSRGGITVREQLAARRGKRGVDTNASTTSSVSTETGHGSTTIANGRSSADSKTTNDETKETAAPQVAALDLSVKSNVGQTPVTSTRSLDNRVSAELIARVVTNGICPSSPTNEKQSGENVGDSAFDGVASMKKRKVAETSSVRLPLTKGWRRQTYVRGMSPNCVRGDVIYYAPCGKRLGSYAEVVRYLNKHDIKDIDRDNFSFSCKVLVGEFLHVKPDGAKNGVVKLSEKELRDLLSKMHSPAAGGGGHVEGEKNGNNATSGRSFNERNRRRGRSSLSRRNATRRSNPLQTRFGAAAASDSRKKDQSALQPPQTEPIRQGWETKRLDRERETQVLEHERKRKMDAMRNQKVMEAMQRAKEKEIRQQQMESLRKQEEQYMQQMVILANMEREKVRQQMLFARALEARRRQEEKERLYAEKLIRREERLAARTATLMKLRQMRQPVEDMEIEDSKELTPLNRMENMQLDGQAFADLLMVMEFVNNFGHVLKIDKTEIPSMSDVHAGLLNDRRCVHSLRSLVKTLLLLVLEYPGLPVGNGGRTLLGQSAKDVGVTDMNMSELLRMFLLSRDDQGKELGNEMNNQPYEALAPTRKASILAYMCNELLYCRNVVREIEGNIDVIAKFKSDRWALEGKLRHMKVVQASKKKDEHVDEDGKDTSASDVGPSTSGGGSLIDKSPIGTPGKLHDDDDHDDDEDDSTSDQEADGGIQESSCVNKRMPKTLFGITAGEIESISKEEKLMSIEEVDKELERLRKEMHDVRSRVNEVSVRVRASPFGQDRYNRYFWILPHHEGVFVEGVESGAVHNPAIKLPPPASSSPGRSASPPKPIDETKSCLQDMVEAISRCEPNSDVDSDSDLDLDAVYAEVKSDRSYAPHQEIEVNTEPVKATRASATKVAGSKRMKAIPVEMQQGWWLVDAPEQLDSIPPNLHHRGIRERQLNRTLTKHGDHVKRAAFQVGKNSAKFKPVNAVSEGALGTTTLRTARRLLNMTRQLEEKVFHANVHVRGWKPTDVPPEASPSHSIVEGGSNSDSSCDSVLDTRDTYSLHNTDDLLNVVKERLLDLELHIERRYFMPAFNRDTNKMCTNASNTPTAFSSSSDKNEEPKLLSEIARLSDSNSDERGADDEDDDDEEDDVPLALERWRSGVGKASNIAQLSMCLEELDAQVAWEKSVMKASCQICRGGDNESQLLLCDGCDMGYHTYCFKPKLDTVPDGDWFCPECIAKATRRPCCLLCCRQASRPMIACTECSKNFHLDCLAGPVKKTRSGAWTCGGCCNSKGKHMIKASNTDNQHVAQVPITPASSEPPAVQLKKKSPKKSPPALKNGARTSPSVAEVVSGPLKFHELCSIMLAELDAHKDAGVFRLPVDTKGCPLYKKIIKQPMDLSTIQTKLTNKAYENEPQFVTDVKLMFDNCRTFNEDDSPIGKSGHALRRYFNRRWKELKESNGKKS